MCSIIIPTYNRKKFEKLIEYNISCQTYNNILEVIIADDGDEDQKLNINVPYPLIYIKCKRMTIGEKRNLLVSRCSGKYIAHMDTDDVYFPSYLEHSISLLEKEKKEVVGSSDMLFFFSDGKTGSMINPLLSMANEATLVYTKLFWEKTNFSIQQSSEGIKFLKGRHWQIAHSDMTKTMICICHSSNTVNKNIWKECQPVELPNYDNHKKILDTIEL